MMELLAAVVAVVYGRIYTFILGYLRQFFFGLLIARGIFRVLFYNYI